MASGDLRDIFISSGVNESGKGFCTVSVNHGDLIGQMSPTEVRGLALQWLEVAEAAEQDGMLFGLLTERLGQEPEHAAYVIGEMRDFRAEQQGGG